MRKYLFFFIFSSYSITSFALSKSPSYETLRAKTMGNAFVALANGRDALNYNVAGLQHSKTRYDNSLDLSMEFYLEDLGLIGYPHYISNVHGDFLRQYISNFKLAVSENLFSQPQFNKDLASIDSKPLLVTIGGEAGFAIQNFGISAWTNGKLYSYFDQGILIPQIGVSYFELNLVIQSGLSWSFNDKWSIGLGIRFIQQKRLEDYHLSITNKDSLLTNLSKKSVSSNGVGFDVGGLWEVTPELFLGSSLQNLFLSLDQYVLPELTVGFNYIPKILQSNNSILFDRTVYLTADYENILLDEDGFLNHLNLGMEISQEILGSFLESRFALGLNNSFNYTMGIGFYLLGFIEIDYGTWTEDLSIISQDFQRIQSIQVTIGF